MHTNSRPNEGLDAPPIAKKGRLSQERQPVFLQVLSLTISNGTLGPIAVTRIKALSKDCRKTVNEIVRTDTRSGTSSAILEARRVVKSSYQFVVSPAWSGTVGSDWTLAEPGSFKARQKLYEEMLSFDDITEEIRLRRKHNSTYIRLSQLAEEILPRSPYAYPASGINLIMKHYGADLRRVASLQLLLEGNLRRLLQVEGYDSKEQAQRTEDRYNEIKNAPKGQGIAREWEGTFFGSDLHPRTTDTHRLPVIPRRPGGYSWGKRPPHVETILQDL